MANNETFTNPRAIQWGTAPVLVRAKTQAGEIKVKASVVYNGVHTPAPAEITIQTVKATHPLIADSNELKLLQNQSKNSKSLMPLNKISQRNTTTKPTKTERSRKATKRF